MCVLNRLTGESPDVRTDVHVGNSRTSKVVGDQSDHRPQVVSLIAVQLEHVADVASRDNQHVSGCNRVVVGKCSR
jgi:hypothetical protein